MHDIIFYSYICANVAVQTLNYYISTTIIHVVLALKFSEFPNNMLALLVENIVKILQEKRLHSTSEHL